MAKKTPKQIVEDQNYHPKHSSNIKASRCRESPKSARKTNRWSDRENKIYLTLLVQNQQNMSNEALRAKMKVFRMLSSQIRTRNPDQCRSHHQKMLKHHQLLSGIICFLSMRLDFCAQRPPSGNSAPIELKDFSDPQSASPDCFGLLGDSKKYSIDEDLIEGEAQNTIDPFLEVQEPLFGEFEQRRFLDDSFSIYRFSDLSDPIYPFD